MPKYSAAGKRARFANIPEAVFLRAAKDLTAAEFLVLACILLCLNWRRGEAWPTVARLQELSGLARDTVTKAKSVLQRHRYITCGWREVKGGGHLIRVLFDMDGNRRDFPTQTTWESRPKPPGIYRANHREKHSALPTGEGGKSAPHHSHEHSQGTHPGTGDPFSIIACPHLGDGKQRMPLGQAFEVFIASQAGIAALTGRTATAIWANVKDKVNDYHEDRVHRGLRCDYLGCIRVPAAKISAMAGARSNPLAYLEKSLARELGTEEDRAQRVRVKAGQNRGGGFMSAKDIAAQLPAAPEAGGPWVTQ